MQQVNKILSYRICFKFMFHFFTKYSYDTYLNYFCIRYQNYFHPPFHIDNVCDCKFLDKTYRSGFIDFFSIAWSFSDLHPYKTCNFRVKRPTSKFQTLLAFFVEGPLFDSLSSHPTFEVLEFALNLR